jgi:hypothetical protein
MEARKTSTLPTPGEVVAAPPAVGFGGGQSVDLAGEPIGALLEVADAAAEVGDAVAGHVVLAYQYGGLSRAALIIGHRLWRL